MLGLYHVGLGFVDIASGEEIVLEYSNNPDYVDDDTPNPLPIYNETTGLYSFEWARTHTVFLRHKIETDYCRWEKQIIAAKSIPGKVLNTLLREYAVPFNNGIGHVYRMFAIYGKQNNSMY